MTRGPFIIATVLGRPIFIAAAVYGPTALDLVFHRRPPERFLIPAGYSGWVRVDFRQRDAPPLPMEDGRRLFKLNAQGASQISSDPQLGHGRDDFFYYSGDRRKLLSNAGVCKGGMVWQIESLVDDRTSTPFERFFAGTESQYRHEVDPTGKEPACERFDVPRLLAGQCSRYAQDDKFGAKPDNLSARVLAND